MPAAVILTLDAALSGCSAAIVQGEAVIAARTHPGGRGSAAALPDLVRQVLHEARADAAGLHAIAVTVGPGSFTGIRAALAVAQGIGLAAGVPVLGVSLGEAIRAEAATDRPLWVVIDSSRGRVFLDRDGGIVSVGIADLPPPPCAIGLAGDAAAAAAAHLAKQGFDVRLSPATGAGPLGIARGAARANRAAVPLYVDPVEARPGPAPRPAPRPAASTV